MIEDSEEGVASIDLAVTFFACVTMMLVFVKFTFESSRSRPPRQTIGQTAQSIEAIPGAWSAVVRRTAHAILTPQKLDIISSEAMAGAIDGSAVLKPEDQPTVRVSLSGRGIPDPAPPNAFVISLSLDPGVLPKGWRRTAVALEPEAPCAEMPEGSVLTVWINEASGEIGPLLDWSSRCGLSLRFEHMRTTETGRHLLDIGLTPAAFGHATIFR